VSDFVIESREHDDTTCTIRARVPRDLRYFEGHFEGDPIVPGIAQLLPLVWDQAKLVWPDLPAPREVKRLKFLDALRPDDALSITLERKPGKLTFEITKGVTRCTRGTLVF